MSDLDIDFDAIADAFLASRNLVTSPGELFVWKDTVRRFALLLPLHGMSALLLERVSFFDNPYA